MNKIIILISTIIIMGCSVQTKKDFYILDYNPNVKKLQSNYKMNYPLPYKLEVEKFSINRIYDRNLIVNRKSFHKLQYFNKASWAVRPNQALEDIFIEHFNRYGLFSECKKNFLDFSADFFVSAQIYNIELYSNEHYSFARLKMDLWFLDKNSKVLVHHEIEREEPLEAGNVAFFVKVTSDIIKEEYNLFIRKIHQYFLEK